MSHAQLVYSLTSAGSLPILPDPLEFLSKGNGIWRPKYVPKRSSMPFNGFLLISLSFSMDKLLNIDVCEHVCIPTDINSKKEPWDFHFTILEHMTTSPIQIFFIILWGEGDIPLPEDHLQESVLTIYHGGHKDQTQVIRLSGKYHHPPSHLTTQHLFFMPKISFSLRPK